MEGGLEHAGSAIGYRNPPIVFTITEDPFIGAATLTAVPVSAPLANSVGIADSLPRSLAMEHPPCTAITPFFIAGIGDTQRKPILLTARQGANSGTVVVDPIQATLRLRPLLRIASRVVVPPRQTLVSIDVASGGLAFIILAVTRTEDGYRGMRVGTSERGSGWNIAPGDRETHLYAIDDRPELYSPCRRSG
jgi:hypothetical protein